MSQELQGIIEALEELKSDATVQKNIKSRISAIIDTLSGSTDMSIKVTKALDELDEVSSDNNIHSYTRTQIWNIVSMLETVR